jgi:hypothetical protein
MLKSLMGQAMVALVYLGIVATFATVTFIVSLLWLLIW